MNCKQTRRCTTFSAINSPLSSDCELDTVVGVPTCTASTSGSSVNWLCGFESGSDHYNLISIIGTHLPTVPISIPVEIDVKLELNMYCPELWHTPDCQCETGPQTTSCRHTHSTRRPEKNTGPKAEPTWSAKDFLLQTTQFIFSTNIDV
jgi:hypothetical protein